MAYQSFPYQGFGRGLNLRDKPDAVDAAEAIDAMNVGFSERGAIVTRGGYVQRVALAEGEEAMGLASMVRTTGSPRILSVVEDRLRAYSTTGSPSGLGDSGSLSTPTVPFSFARYGTPSSERIYASNGTDVRYFDGTNFSTPQVRIATGSPLPAADKAFPKGRYLAVQSTDNRLVSTSFLGATDGPGANPSSPSHVYFSDPGDPETWLTLDYVQLTPGDGEKIQGAVGWRELVFVFKESKFFVFYGNSQNAAGDPIFNYRPVEGGVGLASPFGIATTRNGVYFVGPDGLYRTTGSSAEKVSDAVEPLWTGNTSGYYTGGTISDITSCRLTAVDDTIYMAFTSTEGQRVLVHDTDTGWFSLYDLPAKWVHGFGGTLWFTTTGLPDDYDLIAEHRRTDPDDNGTAIQARWRSGWLDFNSPDIKVVRASKLWGNGRTSIGMSTDFEEDDGSLEDVIFTDSGNDPQWNEEQWNLSKWSEPRGLAPRQRRKAARGTTFSMLIREKAPWAVHRATHQVRQVRQPGIEDDS
jgi:hypothetical protein